MSICFIWIPFGGFRVTKYITSIGLFYKKVGILLGGLSDCEELVGEGKPNRFRWEICRHCVVETPEYLNFQFAF